MIPLNVSFQGLPPSDAVRDDIQERVDRLEKYFDRIIACDVVVSIPHRHHNQGKIPHIQFRLKVPGTTIVVSREPEKNKAHEDVYVAIADSYAALVRQLEDYVRTKREFEHKKISELPVNSAETSDDYEEDVS